MTLRLYELDANDEMYEQYTVQTVVSAQYRKLYAVVSIDYILNCVLLSYTLRICVMYRLQCMLIQKHCMDTIMSHFYQLILYYSLTNYYALIVF